MIIIENLEHQKINSVEAENELVNYSFSYEIVNVDSDQFAIRIIDEIHGEEYTLGEFCSSYDEAYQAMQKFNSKLEEFYSLSDEILSELTDYTI